MSPAELFPRERARWLGTLVLVLAVAALAASATLVMFSAFMFYDDEGYVLLSLRNFIAHGGLYRDVYSQYGPFPFVLYYALDGLGLSLTHTVGRLVTLGAWTGAAISCTALAGFVTRNVAVRLAVLAAVFAYLWVMASEPTHPGGLIVLLTTLLAALGYHLIRRDQMRGWAALAGAGTAMLLLTKINIGAFAAFSAGAWLLLHHRDAKVRHWAPLLLGAFCVLLPLALMQSLLRTPWVQTYAFTFACSAIAVVGATTVGASARADWRVLGSGLLAAILVIAVVLGVVFLRGTTPRDLLEGVLIGPLRQPTTFSLRYVWPAGIHVIVATSLASCAAATLLRRRGIPQVDVVVATLRLVVTVALAAGLARFPHANPVYIVFGFALPCIWLFVWPLEGESSATTSARAWVALLLLGQCLHPFPVPGSQMAWGSVLTIPLAALGAWDAATWLARHGTIRWLTLRSGVVAINIIVVGFAVAMGWKFATVADRYRGGQYLAQPGAEMIRLPDDSAALFRVLTLNATAHADMLFSLPGMFSLNIWTGLPTPTHANVTHWFSLLDNSHQQAIAQALEAHPRACVIIDRGHVDFLNQHGITPRGLLYDYIAKNFEPAFVIDRFEFCVHRGRRIEPFLVADMLTRTESAGTEIPATENTLLKFTALLATSRPVASIELFAGTTLLRLHKGNARIEIAPTNGHGEPIGPARPQGWPFAIKGPGIIFIYFEHATVAPQGTLVLRDTAGEELALARVRP